MTFSWIIRDRFLTMWGRVKGSRNHIYFFSTEWYQKNYKKLILLQIPFMQPKRLKLRLNAVNIKCCLYKSVAFDPGQIFLTLQKLENCVWKIVFGTNKIGGVRLYIRIYVRCWKVFWGADAHSKYGSTTATGLTLIVIIFRQK